MGVDEVELVVVCVGLMFSLAELWDLELLLCAEEGASGDAEVLAARKPSTANETRRRVAERRSIPLIKGEERENLQRSSLHPGSFYPTLSV